MANAGQSAVATTSTEGKASGLTELKNGKVYFKQKCISFEKQSETLQEIVQFREMLTQRIEKQETPLDAIPEEHRAVIAKLAHESDKSLAALSKQIRLELLPTDEDEEGPRNETSPASIALPLNVVEAAIKTIMQRNNYGLDGIGGGKPPAALCVWRWEVKSQYWDWLPKAGREKAEARQKEREQAKQELSKTFYALPQDEQDKLLDPKGMLKASNKDTSSSNGQAIAVSAAKENQPSPAKSQAGKKDGDEDSETPKKGKGRAPKTVDPEKAAKEQEKAEKKAAKVEREKKEQDAKKKSQSLMANFFTKPKKAPAAQVSSSTANEAGPSGVQNEFAKYFKPFVTKKGMTVAPPNYFSTRRREKQPSTDEDVILVDDEDDMAISSVKDTTTPEELSILSTIGHLRSVINHLPPPLKPTPRFTSYKPSGGFKTYSPLAVRDVFSKLSEAEVTGDTNLVRSLHYQLSDRTKFPAKVLIFREDARPGYFGTWTRNSRIIGPRTPLAKDVLVFDYAYDSGEEWEEEPAGDADDVMDDGEDEDGDGDEPDSDLDSWLVDDDEDIDGPLTIDDRELSPLVLPDLPPRTGKRKTDEGDKKAGKKRKVVIPLVPFSKGPCWESSIGHCDDFMDQFKIQLFNDAPFPLDPFTYVAPIEKPTQSNGAVPADGGFAVPSLPVRLLNGSAGPSATNSAESSPAPTGPKKSTPVAKTAFPEALLPQLLKKINALQSKTITFLVDSIHQDLKDQNVKKNSIEAKVREVSEKSKDTKLWVVKPGIQVPS